MKKEALRPQKVEFNLLPFICLFCFYKKNQIDWLYFCAAPFDILFSRRCEVSKAVVGDSVLKIVLLRMRCPSYVSRFVIVDLNLVDISSDFCSSQFKFKNFDIVEWLNESFLYYWSHYL